GHRLVEDGDHLVDRGREMPAALPATTAAVVFHGTPPGDRYPMETEPGKAIGADVPMRSIFEGGPRPVADPLDHLDCFLLMCLCGSPLARRLPQGLRGL